MEPVSSTMIFNNLTTNDSIFLWSLIFFSTFPVRSDIRVLSPDPLYILDQKANPGYVQHLFQPPAWFLCRIRNTLQYCADQSHSLFLYKHAHIIPDLNCIPYRQHHNIWCFAVSFYFCPVITLVHPNHLTTLVIEMSHLELHRNHEC